MVDLADLLDVHGPRCPDGLGCYTEQQVGAALTMATLALGSLPWRFRVFEHRASLLLDVLGSRGETVARFETPLDLDAIDTVNADEIVWLAGMLRSGFVDALALEGYELAEQLHLSDLLEHHRFELGGAL